MAARKRRIDEYDTRFKQASAVLVSISEDNTTPRNIRRAAKEALNSLQASGQSHAIRAAQVINILDDVSQDPNMPPYTRTRIWNVVSVLEVVKE
ncbi:UPF0147 family protein [Candidatus Bathyarchaeota archaeon]|jgi:hypothetical protein|nr:UPF0147 family protein [Candidatus Bathyarchaeota archaeon]